MKTRWIKLVVLAATVGVLWAVPVAEAEVRVSPNYRLNTDSAPYRGKDQVGLQSNPANPQHVVAVNAEHHDYDCEASVSFDGGTTWSAAVPLTPPTPTGNEQPFVTGCETGRYNQSIEFGSGQNVYTAITAARLGAGFQQDPTVLVFKSTNGGSTWQPGVVAMQGGPGNLDFTTGPDWSRPGLAVDPNGGQGGADRVHVVAHDTFGEGTCGAGRCLPLKSVISENGGQAGTFSAPINVTPPTTTVGDFPSKPVLNADDSVVVAWRVPAPTLGPPTFACPEPCTGPIQTARWNPQTRQWGEPVTVTIGKNTGTTVAQRTVAGPSSGGSYPRLAANPQNGHVYIVYTQGKDGPITPPGGYAGADHFISPDSQVYLQRSTTGGQSWQAPKQISQQTSFPGARTHQTRHPNVSVSLGGRVNVVWHDRRHWYQGPGERNCTHSHIFCEDIRLGDTYYSYSTDAGGNFSRPLRITDRSSNRDVGWDTRPSGYWWYGPQSVTIGGGQQLIGWMDSREGNWDTDTDDIYLAKVDLNAPSTAEPTTTFVNQPSNVARSVALAKLAYIGGNEGALVGGPRDPANPSGCTTTGAAAQCPSGPASRNASAVVVVNENDVPAALAGTVLARANPAPVLLSAAGGLSAAVKAEVARIRPAGAYVVGDTGELSPQVVSDLQNAGVPAGQVTRISGGDAAMAASIADRLDYRTQAEKDTNVPAFDAVVIANPASPDAAAAVGLAAARRLPILYVGATIPPETASALTQLDIDKTLVVGGTSAVNATVAGQLPSATRLGGADVYGTSQAVVNESKARGLPSNVVYVADGSKPMEAALLGGWVARATGILALAPAPLYNSGASQASAFGLTGIDKLVLLGPPKPGPSQTPRQPTSPGPGPGITVPAFAGCPSAITNVIRGTAGRNTIRGTAAGDRIFALAGNDVVSALAGKDCVDLGTGADRGTGGSGDDLILGGRGKDRLGGSSGKDKLSGGRDADRLDGGSGNDSLKGSSGKDKLSGGSGKDKLSGGSGNDRINARDRSRDRVNCGSGSRDVAVVDRRDRVSRNCERIRRSRR